MFVYIFVYEVYSNEIVILRYENVEDNKRVTRDHKWKENTDNTMAIRKGIMILQNTKYCKITRRLCPYLFPTHV
jgi:hypothetical protein